MRCAGCSGRLPPSEVVRRVQQYVYHLECFTCAVCGVQLNTGDHFYLMEEDSKLVCKADYYLTINASSQFFVRLAWPFCNIASETDKR